MTRPKHLAAAVALAGFILCFWAQPSAHARCMPTPECGNGFLEQGEECDDGNRADGDGCSAGCLEIFDLSAGNALPGISGNFRDIEVGDLNRDGIDDFVVASYSPSRFYSFLVGADGSITKVQEFDLGNNPIMMDIGLLNGDHFLDVAVAHADSNDLYIIFGNGDGTFRIANIYYPGSRPFSVRIGDVNNDAYADMIVALRSSSRYTLYYGDGLGGFPLSENYLGGEDAISSQIGDLNGDGYNDVRFCYQNRSGIPSLQIFHGSETGLSLVQTFDGVDVGCGTAMHLDGDGLIDIVALGFTEYFPLINNGGGTYNLGSGFDTGAAGWFRSKGDLNNDGFDELVVAKDKVGVLVADGNGWFSEEKLYSLATRPRDVGILDFSRDGTPDILSVTDGGISLLNNNNHYQFPRCGDNRIGRGENCDDGNTAGGDGCSSTCRIETGGDTDKDGLSDYDETAIWGTDPQNPDTDGDCVFDGEEACSGADPRDPSDQDGCMAIVTPPGSWRVKVTLTEASAGLSSDVYLASPAEQRLIKNTLKNVGKIATTELFTGQEVDFFIRVNAASWGLGIYDHYASSVFAHIDKTDAYTYTVGFEDLPMGQADWDYDDVVILVEFIPADVALGVSLNNLDEFENTVDASAANDIEAVNAFDGYSRLVMPAGAVEDGVGVTLTTGLPEKYEELKRPYLLGEFRKVLIANGRTSTIGGKPAEITIPYQDEDNDGVADGTVFYEEEMALYHWNEEAADWEALPSTVDTENNTITGYSANFSLFSVGGILPKDPQAGDSSGMDGEPVGHEDGAFGCVIAGGNETRAKANIAALVLLALLPVIVFRAAAK